jgi:hypothetical protein
VDTITFRARGVADAKSGVRVDPAAEGGVAYVVARRGLFVRALVFAGVSLAPRDFDAGRPAPVFRTPGSYVRAEIDLGVVLGKKTGVGGL